TRGRPVPPRVGTGARGLPLRSLLPGRAGQSNGQLHAHRDRPVRRAQREGEDAVPREADGRPRRSRSRPGERDGGLQGNHLGELGVCRGPADPRLGARAATQPPCRKRTRHWSGPSWGAFPPSGRLLEATYLAIYRIEDGRIAEAWAEWDNLAGLRQLGHA